MKTEDKYDGTHYITAQVVIKADAFAKQMLGNSQNPTPQQLEDFIRDNATLMDVVYGTARIVPKGETFEDFVTTLHTIEEMTEDIQKDTEYISRHISEMKMESVLAPKKEPWYKRLLRI